jgi:hypothetical protein
VEEVVILSSGSRIPGSHRWFTGVILMLADRTTAACVMMLWVACLTGCNSTSTPPASVEEKVDPALLAELGEETEFESYFVRPPKGYFKDAPPGSAALKTVGWGGKPREDGSYSSFMIVIVTRDPQDPVLEHEAVLSQVLQGISQWRQDWAQAKAEEMEINGLKFLRSRWTGTIPHRNWKMHGFTAIAIDGRKLIQITGQDSEPHYEHPLKVMEAAATTFRKK